MRYYCVAAGDDGGLRGSRCVADADTFRQFYSNRHIVMPILSAFPPVANVEVLCTHLMLRLMIVLEQMQLIKCQMAPEINTILIIKRQQSHYTKQIKARQGTLQNSTDNFAIK